MNISAARLLLLLVCLSYVSKTIAFQFSSAATLYDYLTGISNKYIRPEQDLSSPTNISIKFSLTNLQGIDENNGLFAVAGYFEIIWKDKNLFWDPALYGQADNIRLPTSVIWKPHLLLGNPYDDEGTDISLQDSTVHIHADGTAYWHPAGSFRVACDADILYYPFDTQTCYLMILPWTYSETEIFFTIISPTVDLTYYGQNPQWDYKSSRLYNSSNVLYVSMTFKRKPTFFMINIFFPILLLGVLNLFVFLLPADSGERVGFSITLLLSIAVFMTILSDSLPSTSTPRIAAISSKLIGDLVISSLIAVCTILGLVIHHKDESKPVTPFWKRILKLRKVCCCSKKRNDDYTTSATWKDVHRVVDICCLVAFSVAIVASNVGFFLDVVTGTKT